MQTLFHPRFDLPQSGSPDCSHKLVVYRQMDRWRIRRIGLRYAGFVLFDLAICALIVSLNNIDGYRWVWENSRFDLICVVTLVGGAALRIDSSLTDWPIQRYADDLEITALPALALAASLDFWDTLSGSSLRDSAVNAVTQIILANLNCCEFSILYPYSKHLIALMLRSKDPGLVAVIAQWVAAARPAEGMKALRKLERYGWVRLQTGLYKQVRLCIEVLSKSGSSVASSQILLRAATLAVDTALLRPCTKSPILHTNSLPRAAPAVASNRD